MDEDAEAGARIYLEAELEQSREQVARLAERVRTCEQQLEERTRAEADAKRRAENQTRPHEQTIQDLHRTREQLQEATERLR